MPLSPPADRTPQHRRDISLHGYLRADGLFDIEAHLVDTKSYGFDNHDRGHIAPGVPLHEMWARLTVDADMRIVAAEASTEHGPYMICADGAATFSRLVGLVIGPGFLRATRDRLGGVEGCTHLRELLQQLATVAMQTAFPLRARRAASDPDAGAARMINSCHAYASDREPVRRRWPHRYTGPGAGSAPDVVGQRENSDV